MTDPESEPVVIVRRPCGCVLFAGRPDDRREAKRTARAVHVPGETMPVGAFRSLPWGCPLCSIEEAVKAERDRCAAVADSFSAHQYADPKAVADAIRRGP